MASTSAADIHDKADLIYSKCFDISSTTETFNQADLVAMNIASNLTELLQFVQQLMQANLFQILTLDGAPCYRCRTREDAAKMADMGDKEFIVYSMIEASGTSGIWTKTLGVRTNLHTTVLTKALKFLEGKSYVKQIKSVKFPKRKIYMLSGLNPAEEVTGGPWFSDGEMDVEFIASIGDLVEGFVKRESWREDPSVKKMKPAETNLGADQDRRFYGIALSERGRPLVPHPPGYAKYPTTSDILTWIDSMGIIQDKDITSIDMNNLLDVLVYDGKLERIGKRLVPRGRSATATPAAADFDDDDDDEDDGGPPRKRRNKGKRNAAASETPKPQEQEYEDMFRWVRRPEGEEADAGPGNGFSEAPCSRCPVFRLCEDGGPVDARSCGYFAKWLTV